MRSNLECFYTGYDGDEQVGIEGLEIYGTDGLLWSVVTKHSARGNGFGTAIYRGLETEARADGAKTLYLLTTTVPEFFGNRGYVEIERTDAPATIQQTTEFDNLCPTTATCMKNLVALILIGTSAVPNDCFDSYSPWI